MIPIIMLSLSMFPQISIAGYLFRLMAKTGLINTYAALIFPYTAVSLPLGLWIMISYFSQLPVELDNAALIDGASKFDVLYKILFPIAIPGILSTFLLTFIFSFNEFIFALMMTFDYHSRTVPVGIALFQGIHGQIPWGSIMAAATISSLPLIIITIIFNRFIIRGLTEGALKG
jgi:multiple sugar transport system permease protein